METGLEKGERSDFCRDPRERLETRIKGLGGREVWLQMDLGIQVGGK